MNITFDNFLDYPKGTEVLFKFGAYYPEVEGVVTGFKVIPGSAFLAEDTVVLIAEYKDTETNKTVETRISGFAEKGVVLILSKLQTN
jgi:hypothetical protein